MFFSKKKKIAAYLQAIPDPEKTAFDMLLADYLDGTLKNKLESLGIRRLEQYISWNIDSKCICVQGRCKNYYMDVQIDTDEFFVAFDLDEADEGQIYPTNSSETVYQTISDAICALE